MKKVIISQKAYLSILAEVYERVETETGGILLGHREGDTWYVLESVEPGMKSIFTPTYFEYDDEYVNYRANKIRRLYKCSIELLGLWHRHPSLMKTFSSTDDETNKTYSDQLNGAISGIVTLGNGFEITMYYVPSNIRYEKIEWVVDDSQIPKSYLAYYDTAYYQDIIEEEAAKIYGNRFRKKASNSTSNCTESSNGSKKGILSALTSKISDFFSVSEESIDDKCKTESSNNDELGYIFDSIEEEIAYLQKIEATGDVESTIEATQNSKGKDGIIIRIKDKRNGILKKYRLVFFMSKNKIFVNTDDDSFPYEGSLIYSILTGGKYD